jgi:ligand-binding SRPBCC domain-containing protein
MGVYICPIANIEAPLERVWSFLSEPANYALWWDAQTQAIAPAGSAQPGQKIKAQSRALGKQWEVNILVEGVDEPKHQLHLKTMLPFGITVFNHITCTAINNAATQVTFG